MNKKELKLKVIDMAESKMLHEVSDFLKELKTNYPFNSISEYIDELIAHYEKFKRDGDIFTVTERKNSNLNNFIGIGICVNYEFIEEKDRYPIEIKLGDGSELLKYSSFFNTKDSYPKGEFTVNFIANNDVINGLRITIEDLIEVLQKLSTSGLQIDYKPYHDFKEYEYLDKYFSRKTICK